MSKLRIKYNSGNMAILCSRCSVIIKEGYLFSDDELECAKGNKNMVAQYCDKCKKDKR